MGICTSTSFLFRNSRISTHRPHIAYLTASDPANKRSWSGIHYYASKALERSLGKVTPLGPWHPSAAINFGRGYSLLAKKLTGKRFDYSHSVRLAKTYGRYFSQKLREGNYDLVVAVAASSELAFLDTDLPVYYVADATFAGMIDYYAFYSSLLPRSIREGNTTHRLALQKARQLFYPSEWAANSAINDYGITAANVHRLPFGANLDEIPTADSLQYKNESAQCRLLFLGVEWERKGGPVALEALRLLRQKGIDATLTIVGCNPALQEAHVRIIPFLDKNDASQRSELFRVLTETDFLVLPTRAECFGVVFCEASAFGVPSLSTDTGGVPGAVKNGVNGFLFSPEATGAAYAEKITELFADKAQLTTLKRSARALYESELNWNVWGDRVAEIIRNDLRAAKK